MTSRSRGTVWFRDEYRDKVGELETREEFEVRRGLEPGTLGYRFYDYADKRPKKVKEEGRTHFYVRKELDEFFDGLEGRKKPRTRAEKLKADVVRAQGTVRECEKGVEEAKKIVEKRERRLAAKKKNLKRLEEHYAIEVKTETQ